MAKPSIGDMIEHSEPEFERVVTGKVIELFDLQFLYEVHKVVEKDKEKIPVDKTSTRMCLYNDSSESWKKI